MINQEKRAAFMAACKGYTAHQVARAVGKQTPGIDWRGCSKGYIANSYAREWGDLKAQRITQLSLLWLQKDLSDE